ncbi:hypothetical protein RFI_03799 [Reticulomyxa filosa]|uniref:Uncharacterized protein n=1 Tax=Reticulomyxa filosa TaxID=46433 RepID=X6P5D7_RETFI|nr:hypothetical protein RFI_03799 [Reticulomyxa filosa]|eukprot:ETO33309.1 hypothetical protein RFI_03799 [Reticulomyxa filosa]
MLSLLFRKKYYIKEPKSQIKKWLNVFDNDFVKITLYRWTRYSFLSIFFVCIKRKKPNQVQFKQTLTYEHPLFFSWTCFVADLLCAPFFNFLFERKSIKREMSSIEGVVTIDSKEYTLNLISLTLEDLKEEIVKVAQENEQENALMKITDPNGHDIETDQQLQSMFPLCFHAYFEPKKEEERDEKSVPMIIETLNLDTHWNKNWRRANTKAVKTVMEMIKNNEQGLVVVVNNTNLWQIAISKSSVTLNDNSISLRVLINNGKAETQSFGEYCLYVLKSKMIQLNEINIDGNVYAVNCEIQCKGKDVKITTYLFVANAIVHPQLTQSISPISWNTKVHHDILVHVQDLEDKAEMCSSQMDLNDAISSLQEALKFSIDNIGANHPYIAILYCCFAKIYHRYMNYDKAIKYYKKAQTVFSKAFGEMHLHVGNTLYNLGNIYCNKGDYDKTIECYQHSLKIRKEILKINDTFIGSCYWNLASISEQYGDINKAQGYYEEAWKTNSALFGEWNEDTLQAKAGTQINI